MQLDQALENLSLHPYVKLDNPPVNYVISSVVGRRVAESLDNVNYGVFHNGREWGLTFTSGLWTFCVYEHRRCDLIQIQGCPTSEMQSFGPYGGNQDTSDDTLYSAPEGAYEVVAVALISMLRLAAGGKTHTREEMSEAAWVKTNPIG